MRYLVLLMVVGLALAGCGSDSPWPANSVPVPTLEPSESPSQVSLPGALPTRIEIPDLNAQSSLIETGVDRSNKIETPPVKQPMQASWYSLSPRPGDVGPSIVLGHVDGDGKRGIFYRLRELKSGSLVHIQRDDGSTVSFEVYEVGQFPKKNFPTGRVYGDTNQPEIRLVTCGGAFGNASPGHYDDNIVAFGRLTPSG